MPSTPKISMKTSSGGELLAVRNIAEKAQVSEATVKRILSGNYIDVVMISGTKFVYYIEFLRDAWMYECDKERLGRKHANAN